FDSIKDPVSRWFFKSDLGDLDADAAIDTMIKRDTRSKLAQQEVPAFELVGKPPVPERIASGRNPQQDVEGGPSVELPKSEPASDLSLKQEPQVMQQDIKTHDNVV